MRYVLATVEVPDQERQYYAGPIRKIAGRMAHKVAGAIERRPVLTPRKKPRRWAKILAADSKSSPWKTAYDAPPGWQRPDGFW